MRREYVQECGLLGLMQRAHRLASNPEKVGQDHLRLDRALVNPH